MDVRARRGLIIHGALLSRLQMLPLLAHLPGDLSWSTPDLAGHGQYRESHVCLQGMDPVSLAAELQERVQIEKSEPLIVLGHSLGALVAIELFRIFKLRGRLFLGDPPLWPCGDTMSQLDAKQVLIQDPVGRRLLVDSFSNFDGSVCYEHSLQQVAASTDISVDVVVGLCGRHQTANGSWDCGTFIGEQHRQSLRNWANNKIGYLEQSSVGHFVFHDVSVLAKISESILKDESLNGWPVLG